MDLSSPLRVLPIPTGPTIEFRALPFPLPEAHREALKHCRATTDGTSPSLRRVIGVGFRAPEYTHADMIEGTAQWAGCVMTSYYNEIDKHAAVMVARTHQIRAYC